MGHSFLRSHDAAAEFLAVVHDHESSRNLRKR